MARKQQKIKTVSYCFVGDQLTPVSELNEEQKERLAIAIRYGILSTQFAGKAEFYAPGFEIGHDRHGRITVQRLPATTGAM